jgi:hypothetical protein
MIDSTEMPKGIAPEPRRLDPDRFSKFASGLQSIAAAIAIVVGGLWVLYTFRELGTVEKSRAELAALDLKQRSTEEELAERQPILSIELKWEASGGTADGKRFISMQAKLRNDGKKPVEFRAAEALISRLLQKSGQPDPDVKVLHINAQVLNNDGSVSGMPERILRTGQARTIAFLTPPLIPGNYLVQVQTIYDGMLLISGEFKRSADEEILAIEQSVVNVASGTNQATILPAVAAQPRTSPQ